jgi:tripartite-type tricarboxylate transporter receptor subunit TctC
VVATHKPWLEQRKITVLVQTALGKHLDLPDVPLVLDLATTDEQRQIIRLVFARQVMGRPFVAPPGISADRVGALRQAFMATMKDPQFLADAEKAKLEITPVAGDEVEALVRDVYRTPSDIVGKAAAMIR